MYEKLETAEGATRSRPRRKLGLGPHDRCSVHSVGVKARIASA